MKLLNRSSSKLATLATVGCAAAIGWFSISHYLQGRSRSGDAQRALAHAVSLAEQIVLLRHKPDRAAVQSRSEQSLAEVVEKSATAAGVAREQVARVEPQPPRRSGDSDYLEHATVVQLDGVTLAQLAATLSTLRGGGTGVDQLRVSALRIAAPYQAAAGTGPEPWNVELTLTYLVYAPKNASPRKT